MRKPILLVGVAAATALAVTGCGDSSTATEGMPDQIVWSTYGTGTSTYADVAAVADAITSNEGTSVRVITSDTAVGRMTPLREGQAQLARTGDEYIFAFEGDYDFANEDWGPQDTRMVWAPVAPHGLLVRDDSDIKTFEDLRGKKFPQITANPSVNNKLEAFLAYGGLTWDDVQVVEVGYSDQPGALQAGQIDVLFQQVYGASLYELDSAMPVRWLDMEDTSPEKVQAVEEIAPSTEIGEFSGAPGQEKGETANGLLYTVPVITYADVDESTVYNIAKAIESNFEDYKDTTAVTPAWSLDDVLTEPKQVPFHPGVIKLLEEKDAWSQEAQQRQDELLERGEWLDEEWKKFLGSDQAGGENVHEAWNEWKNENVETP
jgi:TRAP transporter TAXI family solute receptor